MTRELAAWPLAGAVGRAVRPRVVRNLLSGTDLGHPLHPVLTTAADLQLAVALSTRPGARLWTRRARPALEHKLP